MDINDRFDLAIEQLYEENFCLANQVCRLGYPKVVKGYPPTAAVRWDKDKKKVEFLFNKNFAEMLSDDDFKFVVAHEASHIINGHVFLMRNEMEKMKYRNSSNKEINAYLSKFNKAADCVVNDTLVNLYGLPRCELKDDKGELALWYGKEKVGCECHDLTVQDVLQLLPEEPEGGEEGNDGSHAFWKSFFNEDGSVNRDFAEKMNDFLDEMMDSSGISDQDLEELKELEETMEKTGDGHGSCRSATGGAYGKKRLQLSKAALNWDRIFFNKVSRNKYEDYWGRRNKRMTGFSDRFKLPVSIDKEVEEIFVAVDVSGSISWEALDLFVSLLKNTPKHFKINAITFNTSCKPFDINDSNIRTGGGTRFDIIERYIQENCKKHPSVVFVLTDGEGNEVSPQHPGKWVWLLYGCNQTRYCKNMSSYKIEDLLR